VISFRFHIVSITAVFLAIALGVLVGSTFVDRAIVDGLENRIDSVSNSLDERREEISTLRDEQDRIDEFTRSSATYMLSNRLAGESVLVVAQRGVDEDAVREVVEMADAAGAVAPGVLWVEPRWGEEDTADVEELAGLVGASPAPADRIRTRAWRDALTDLRNGPASSAEAESSVFDALDDAGYFSFEAVGSDVALDDLAGTDPILIAVTGPNAEPALVPLLQPMLTTAIEIDMPVVAAEVFAELGGEGEPAPARGELAVAGLPDSAAGPVSVVDHLDTVQGRIAAVLAAADLLRNVSGHYGYGAGAASALPPWTPR
jgi:hypothetical protein